LAANSLVEALIFNFDTEDSADPLCNVWCGVVLALRASLSAPGVAAELSLKR
jgi:hypothetical protein